LLPSINPIAAGSILQQGLSATIFLILTRNLGASGYGAVAMALAIASSVYYFSSFWLAPNIVAFGAKEKRQLGKLGPIFCGGCALSLALSAIALLLFLMIAALGLIQANTEPQVTALLVLGMVLLHLALLGFQASQRFFEYGLMLWGDKAIHIVAVLIFLYGGFLNSRTVLYSAGFSMLMVSSIGIYAVVKSHMQTQFRQLQYRELVRISFPVFPAMILAYFSSPHFAILLAGTLHSAGLAGSVSAAIVVAGALAQPVMWVTPRLLPALAESLEAEREKTVERHLRVTILRTASTMAAIVIVLSSLSPFASLVLGKTFVNSGPVISAVICATVAEVTNMLVTPVLYVRHLERAIFMAALAKAAVFVVAVIVIAADAQQGISLGYLAASWIGLFVNIFALKESRNWNIFGRLLMLCLLSSLPAILMFQFPLQASFLVSSVCLIGVALFSADLMRGLWQARLR